MQSVFNGRILNNLWVIFKKRELFDFPIFKNEKMFKKFY